MRLVNFSEEKETNPLIPAKWSDGVLMKIKKLVDIFRICLFQLPIKRNRKDNKYSDPARQLKKTYGT